MACCSRLLELFLPNHLQLSVEFATQCVDAAEERAGIAELSTRTFDFASRRLLPPDARI